MKNIMLNLFLLTCISTQAKVITVVIASKNAQKREAVEKVFNQKFSNINDTLEFVSFKTSSLVPEQPVGLEVATKGAHNRLNSIPKDILDLADYIVAIENYIEQSKETGIYNDFGLVLLKEKNKPEIICISQPTLIPDKYIELTKRMSDTITTDGYSFTIGQAIATDCHDKVIDAHNWHKEIEFGGTSRTKLLHDTLYKAINNDKINEIKSELKIYENFPKEGIIFIDFLPILANPKTFESSINLLANHYKNEQIDVVVGLESRGFILAAALALKLNAGFVPVRKPGKLPSAIHSVSYKKEYGSDTFTIAKDSLTNKRVLIIDDLIATGGSARAAIELVKLAGGIPLEFVTILQVKELAHLTQLSIPAFNLID